MNYNSDFNFHKTKRTFSKSELS